MKLVKDPKELGNAFKSPSCVLNGGKETGTFARQSGVEVVCDWSMQFPST